MGDQKLKLTYEQLRYITEQTGMSDPKEAMTYFAEIMKKEGLRPRQMSEVVAKLMEREKKLK